MPKEKSELGYEEMLRANPRQPALWCALGETRLRQNKVAEARAAFENALRLDPAMAKCHFGVAGLCKQQGRPLEALAYYRTGLVLVPDDIQALIDFGVVLAEQGRLEEAIANWQRILILQPEHAQTHHNVGVVMAQKGQPEEAITYLERALALKPDYAEAWYNLANVHSSEGRGARNEGRGNGGKKRAIECYLRAIRLRPGYVEAYHNVGAVLSDLGRAGEAILWLKQAFRLCKPTANGHPLTASTFNQLGLALSAQARFREAEQCYAVALRHQPGLSDAHSNLGNLFQEQGRLPEALTSYELALVHDPESPTTRWNRSLSLLQSGDFENGWREYEWRWKRKLTPPRPFNEPRWDGSPFEGRTLLVYMEQGLGDIIQFIRFVELAKERGGRIVVECPYFVLPLLAGCRGIDELAVEGAPLPRFDVQIPVMSLPGALGTTLETVPAATPYLYVDEERVERWGEWLRDVVATPPALPCQGGENAGVEPPTLVSCHDGEKTGAGSDSPLSVQQSPTATYVLPPATQHSPLFTIGIAWQGNPHHRLDRYRSIALREFARLACVPGLTLVSLQKGPGAAQIQELKGKFPVWEPPQSEHMTAEALLDTAALMKNLDLIISVDTGTAHLAGALGVPVWTPLSAIGEWRWLLHREDSPWYPTMRLFRQKKLGQWRPVFRRMANELRKLVAGGDGLIGNCAVNAKPCSVDFSPHGADECQALVPVGTTDSSPGR